MTATVFSRLAPLAPWTDRTGQLSVLRLVVFLALLVPGVLVFQDLAFGPIRPEPFEFALHQTGEWAVRILVLSLAVTPVRRIFRWNRVVGLRRMIGVTALAYAVLHLGLYMAQENWVLPKIASEIALRFYLTIGFVALLALIALGATSFDRAIRTMGPRWTTLHRLVYPATALALFHHFLQAKADVSAATLLSGLFVLLMLYRLIAARRWRLENIGILTAAALVASALTAGLEYAWYALATNLPAERVFMANFNLALSLRPAVLVLLAGLAVAAIRLGLTLATSLKARLRAA